MIISMEFMRYFAVKLLLFYGNVLYLNSINPFINFKNQKT